MIKVQNSGGNAFTDIFGFMMIWGFPFHSNSLVLKSNGKDEISFTLKVWSIFSGTIKTLLLALSLFFMKVISPTTSVTYTLYAFNFCGYINMWIICLKRNSICATIRKVTRLSESISPKTFVGRSYVKLEIFFTVVSVFVLMIIVISFYSILQWGNIDGLLHAVLGQEAGTEQLTGAVIFSMVFTHSISVLMCFIALYLCDTSFYALNKIMDLYGENLKAELKRGDYSHKTVSRYIYLFKQIHICVKELDKSLNMIVFFLYGATVSNFFNTVSVLTANSDMYKNPLSMAYVSWTTMNTFVVFMVLTLSGSKVSENGDVLAHTVLMCSGEITEFSPDLETMAAFSLLVQNVKTSSIEISGWGMFTIQKNFILNIASVMVTYGVLMYQLDALKTD